MFLPSPIPRRFLFSRPEGNRYATIVAICQIQRRNCAFDTSTESLEKLKAAGVPNPVILAMVRAS